MARLNDYFIWTGIFPFLKLIYKHRIMKEGEAQFFKEMMEYSWKMRTNSYPRNDFLDYLVGLKKKRNLNFTQLTAHAMVFFLDGYDTCSVALENILVDVSKSFYSLKKYSFNF